MLLDDSTASKFNTKTILSIHFIDLIQISQNFRMIIQTVHLSVHLELEIKYK